MVGIKTLRRLSCDLNRKINRFLRNLFKKNNDIDRNIVNFVDDSNHVFFGYYDVSPFHPDNDILLAMKVPYRRKINVAKTKATLGFFDMADLSFHDFGTSASWCWQQGCRMQWVRNLDSFAVLHNEIENQKYFSQIVDIRTGKILARKNKPIYSISQNCEWGLSLDFSRLERLRPGYGYSNLEDKTKNQLNPEKSGIWRVNLQSGKSNLLFSIRDISKILNHKFAEKGEHYFNHILFHPDGRSFIFFHICQSKQSRQIRLLKSDIEYNDVSIIVDIDYKISHVNWLTGTELVAYLGSGPHGPGYYLIHINENKIIKLCGIPHDLDGHPSASRNGKYIITDTVVNKYSERDLYLFDIPNNNISLLGSYYSPPRYHLGKRCDLHPRADFENKRVCIDSAHTGKRGMFVVNYGDKINIS